MCDMQKCSSASSTLPDINVPDHKRRAFLQGLAALPLAAVLADSALAKAAAERTMPVTVDMASNEKITGHIALPKGDGPHPTLILIHEWWGLNDYIKSVADHFAEQGYIAFAVDLYQGQVATTREDANKYRKAMDPMWATEALVSVAKWLKSHSLSNGKVGTLGWCFGGGWSLNASLTTDVDATVIYYGNVKKSAEQLASLNSPVLGHFGTLDKNINQEMVNSFVVAANEAGKADLLDLHWYDANHAFANPTGSRYDSEDAALALERTLAFLKQHLA
ncbi:MAG: dienelactone hydrolase family protein [Pontibacterium sp.]